MQRFRFLLWQRDGRGSHGPNKGQIAIVVAKAYPDREEPGRGKVLAMARSRAAASRQADRRGDHDHCEDHQRRFVELNQCRPPVKGPKRKPRHRGARGLVSRTMSDAAMRPDPRDKPRRCGVTVTDWRLYTADHRQLDGGDPEASSTAGSAPSRTAARTAARDVSCQLSRPTRVAYRTKCATTAPAKPTTRMAAVTTKTKSMVHG